MHVADVILIRYVRHDRRLRLALTVLLHISVKIGGIFPMTISRG
jgi:hypothetical protein